LAAEAAERVPEHRLWKPESFLVEDDEDLHVVLGDLGAANPTWRGEPDPDAFRATVMELLGAESRVRERLAGRVKDAKAVARAVCAALGSIDVDALARAEQIVHDAVETWTAPIPRAPLAATRTPAIDPTTSAVFVFPRAAEAPPPAPPPPAPPPAMAAPPPSSGGGLRMAILLVGIGGVALVGFLGLTALGIWSWQVFGS
jgi:hypothetical protein